MLIIDIESNTSVGGLTLDPAGMHCPSWDDAFVSSYYFILFIIFFILHLALFSAHFCSTNVYSL